MVNLLGVLFDGDSLRRFLINSLPQSDLRLHLPADSASLIQISASATDLLEQRGMIDHDFFDSLLSVRPHQRAQIESARAQWLPASEMHSGAYWTSGVYQLIEELGHGAYGRVWKAIDTRTDEDVAIKILHEQYATDQVHRKRFLRGSHTLARLHHPGIVKVISPHEREGGRIFFSMEFIAGKTFAQLVEDGELSITERIDILLQVGDALTYIHKEGYLHRDVKPNNILVTQNNRAKLIDFDLVRGGNFLDLTSTLVGGSVLYAAPEVMERRIKPTQTADVYSLAMTTVFAFYGTELPLHELLSSKDAFLSRLPCNDIVRNALRSALLLTPSQRTPSVRIFCSELQRYRHHDLHTIDGPLDHDQRRLTRQQLSSVRNSDTTEIATPQPIIFSPTADQTQAGSGTVGGGYIAEASEKGLNFDFTSNQLSEVDTTNYGRTPSVPADKTGRKGSETTKDFTQLADVLHPRSVEHSIAPSPDGSEQVYRSPLNDPTDKHSVEDSLVPQRFPSSVESINYFTSDDAPTDRPYVPWVGLLLVLLLGFAYYFSNGTTPTSDQTSTEDLSDVRAPGIPGSLPTTGNSAKAATTVMPPSRAELQGRAKLGHSTATPSQKPLNRPQLVKQTPIPESPSQMIPGGNVSDEPDASDPPVQSGEVDCGNGLCEFYRREDCNVCPRDCKCPTGQTCQQGLNGERDICK